MTALHVGVTARKGHIAHAVWKGKKFSQKMAAGLFVLPSHWPGASGMGIAALWNHAKIPQGCP